MVNGPILNVPSYAEPAKTQARELFAGLSLHLQRVAFQRGVRREPGGFDETFDLYGWEDTELGVRLRSSGVQWSVCLGRVSVARQSRPRRTRWPSRAAKRSRKRGWLADFLPSTLHGARDWRPARIRSTCCAHDICFLNGCWRSTPDCRRAPRAPALDARHGAGAVSRRDLLSRAASSAGCDC